jgi:thymidylate synthase (FAD)
MVIEVTYVDHMGTDLTVANAARVSFGKKSEMDSSDPWGPPFLKVKDAKLIRYLAKHKHISPFGHCFASFHIKAPVFVARQLVKHKFLRWNEIRSLSSTHPLYGVVVVLTRSRGLRVL